MVNFLEVNDKMKQFKEAAIALGLEIVFTDIALDAPNRRIKFYISAAWNEENGVAGSDDEN